MIDLDLLEQIYDVVLGRSTWDEVLTGLRAGFSTERGILLVCGEAPGAVDIACRGGYEESVVRDYGEHFAALDPYVQAIKSGAFPAGRVLDGDVLMPEKRLVTLEFYQDWLRPSGLRYSAGAHVRVRDGRNLLFGLTRSPGVGAYTPEEVRSFQSYFNHIGRALELQDALRHSAVKPDFDRLAARYRLTPAESRLVESLVEAGSLKKAAQSGGRSYSTLRAHLRAVFEKTGTHSQPQLMRLIHQEPGDA